MNSTAPNHAATAPPSQFSDGAMPLAEIGRKMCAALNEGSALVCIATGRHRRLLEAQLTLYGIDIAAMCKSGQYASLNALDTLSKIIVEDALDVVRFAELVGAVVDRSAAHYPRVLIFGELVPLMRTDGESRAAIELEAIWNGITTSRPMFQHCVCPADALEDYRTLPFARTTFRADLPELKRKVSGD